MRQYRWEPLQTARDGCEGSDQGSAFPALGQLTGSPQMSEYGQHPPMIVRRRQELELREDAGDVGLYRLRGEKERVADRLVRIVCEMSVHPR